MVSAGRILFIYRGPYNPEQTYFPMDWVNYQGCSWVCEKQCIGVEPEDGEYWTQWGTQIHDASEDVAGVVKIDNETIALNENGQLKVLEGGARIVTLEQFEEIVRERPEERVGKQHAIIDDADGFPYGSETQYGNVIISKSTNETEDNGKVLSATEKNPDVEGSMAHDISKVTAKLSELKADNIPIEITRDILIENSYVDASNGSFIAYNYWSRTDYIELDNSWSRFVAKIGERETKYNAFYDENKSFISSFTVGMSDTDIIIPPNARYVIFSTTSSSILSLELKAIPAITSTRQIAQKLSDNVEWLQCNLFDENNLENVQVVAGSSVRYGHQYTEAGSYVISAKDYSGFIYANVRKTDGTDTGTTHITEAEKRTIANGEILFVYAVYPEELKNKNIMVTKGTNVPSTYVPFSKSNVEITQELSVLGNVIRGSNIGITSLASGAEKSVRKLTLEKGIYLVTGTVVFSTNANGSRHINISITEDATMTTGGGAMRVAGNSSSATAVTTTVPIELVERATVYLNARQDSGVSLNLSWTEFTAIKIK